MTLPIVEAGFVMGADALIIESSECGSELVPIRDVGPTFLTLQFLLTAFEGEIQLGGFKISCAVLEDGTRLVSQRGFANAIGLKAMGSPQRHGLLSSAIVPHPHKSHPRYPCLHLYRSKHEGGAVPGITAELVGELCGPHQIALMTIQARSLYAITSPL